MFIPAETMPCNRKSTDNNFALGKEEILFIDLASGQKTSSQPCIQVISSDDMPSEQSFACDGYRFGHYLYHHCGWKFIEGLVAALFDNEYKNLPLDERVIKDVAHLKDHLCSIKVSL
jgi:hypothetical protein